MERFAVTACVRAAMVGALLVAVSGAHADGSSSVRMTGFAHDPLGGATLTLSGSRLHVAPIGNSGSDGVRVHLGAGVSALRLHVKVADERKLPPGAYLQVSSCATGATDSIGFLRITRASAASGYEVTGAVTGPERPWVSAYRSGKLVFRDQVFATGDALARVPACLACGSNLNDAAGGSPSPVALRWQWKKPLAVVLLHRVGGADTSVVADELRLTGDPGHGGTVTLSDLYVRGRDLGELWIDSESATRSSKAK